MIGVNLIPAARRASALATRRLAIWARAVMAYAMAAAIAGLILRLPADAGSHDLRFAIADADARLERSIRERDAARTRMDRLQKTIDNFRIVAEHPDWSVLLGLLSHLRGEGVVLESCELTPAYPPDEKRNPLLLPPTAEVFRLRLSGVGLDQTAITEYARALQNSRAFTRVELLQTLSREREGSRVVSFSIECTLAASPATEVRR